MNGRELTKTLAFNKLPYNQSIPSSRTETMQTSRCIVKRSLWCFDLEWKCVLIRLGNQDSHRSKALAFCGCFNYL